MKSEGFPRSSEVGLDPCVQAEIGGEGTTKDKPRLYEMNRSHLERMYFSVARGPRKYLPQGRVVYTSATDFMPPHIEPFEQDTHSTNTEEDINR